MPAFKARALAGALALLLLSGCGMRDRSLADRCAEVLREAWPRGRIEVTSQQAKFDAANDLTTATASVSGKVTGLTGGPREVGLQCQFHNEVLSGFRWTEGLGSGSSSGP